MANSWSDTEKALYDRSRALKMQAREMRKVRLAKEQAAAEAAVAERKKRELAEAIALAEKRKNAKEDRDKRIRQALLSMATAAKNNNVAFESPNWGTQTRDAFYLIDNVSGQKVLIRTTRTGFNWD